MNLFLYNPYRLFWRAQLFPDRSNIHCILLPTATGSGVSLTSDYVRATVISSDTAMPNAQLN